MQKFKRLFSLLLSFSLLSTSMFLLPWKKALAAESLNRYFGDNRYETALAISNGGWDKSDNVILATGKDFPDALCATPLARKLDAPILLTDGAALSSGLTDLITALQTKNVFIIGGERTISPAVESKLKDMGLKVTRLFGDNRYLTSLKVANYMNENFDTGNEAAVATGAAFPDALSIATVAAKKGMPILLSAKDTLPDGVKTYIIENKITKTYIVGGTNAISDKVMNELPGHERISGNDRYETNAAILNRFKSDLDFSTTYLATGEDFPDALAGSALASKTGSPVVLTYKVPKLITSNLIESRASSIKQLKVFGGETVVPSSTVSILTPVINTRGNTVGNLTNRGHAAQQGSWIYYSAPNSIPDSYGLYKIRTDNTGKQKISGRAASNINVIGEWIYFIDKGNYPCKIYKVKTDGTGETLMSQGDAYNLVVIGDWIYYALGAADSTLYKMKTDGTENQKLGIVEGGAYTIDGDWIYYPTSNGMQKMKTDGTEVTKLCDDYAFSVNVEGDWIYYTNYSDRDNYRTLYKIKIDGTGRTALTKDTAYDPNVENGWIYYMNLNDDRKLYKMKTDGSGKARITNEDTEYANIVGDWIYYTTMDSNSIYKYYRVKKDGSGRELIK